MIRHNIRGGYRLLDVAGRMGWLNRVVRYPLSPRVSIDVPLFREDNCLDRNDIQSYESALMQMLAEMTPRLASPVTLIDGGADIGLFTTRMVARHSNIARVHAVEPNERAHQWLRRNMNMLQVECHSHCAAVADFCGRGELKSPEDDRSDHAKYIAGSDNGPVPVVRIDDLTAHDHSNSLILKLDVEGAELKALRGAEQTIRQARQGIVVFEANPRVMRRTGVDAVECMRWLNSLRRFEFHVAESPDARLSSDRPFIEQVDRNGCSNIVAVSV